MAGKAPLRVRRQMLQSDLVAFDALQDMEGYDPAREELAIDRLTQLAAAMTAARTRETQERIDYEAARDQAAADEWAFHEAILGAKEQVRALFGSDSLQVQALGLTMKSKRKRPSQRNGIEQPAAA